MLAPAMDVLDDLAPVSDAYASLPGRRGLRLVRRGRRPRHRRVVHGRVPLDPPSRCRRGEAVDVRRVAPTRRRPRRPASSTTSRVRCGPDGSCLSFCLWQDRADARSAAGRPAHVEAVGPARRDVRVVPARVPPRPTRARPRVARVRALVRRAAGPRRAGRRRRASPRVPARRPPLLTAVTAAEGGLRSFDPRVTIGRLVPGLLAAIAVAAVARLVSGSLPSAISEVTIAVLLGILVGADRARTVRRAPARDRVLGPARPPPRDRAARRPAQRRPDPAHRAAGRRW